MLPSNRSELMSTSIIVGLILLVFVADALTPLGYAEWVFYIVPVALCVLQSRPGLPVAIAVAMMPLLILGFFLSPPGAPLEVGIFNRACAILVVGGVAYLASRVVTQRLRAQHLMWIEQGRAEVAKNLLGEPTVGEVSEKILLSLAEYFDARVAVLYRLENNVLLRTASCGLDVSTTPERLELGSGLTGQVAKTGKAVCVDNLYSDYLRISSATGSTRPATVVIAPLTTEGHVSGVIEFGFLRQGSFDNEIKLLQLVAHKIGSGIRSAQYREDLQELLEETQRQSEELQAQQEELRVTNEELNEQAKALQEAQADLEAQHTELEQSNVLLEERNALLEQQKRSLQLAQQEIEKKADELAKASQYKSEFLANMSHELRTPLNSALILAHMLAENKGGTLTEEQVRHARTIHAANTDLLNLINDILDLSRIEAGQLAVTPAALRPQAIVDALRPVFEPIAASKGVAFRITVDSGLPPEIVTDEQRLSQILKNLLSNAFKFTERGEVELQLRPGGQDRIRIAVRDTGIGIAPEQQEVIFNAFQQANGSIARTYGGTGLGLSISRELARLLGGDISVQSAPGTGSTFTLDIPVALDADTLKVAAAQETKSRNDAKRLVTGEIASTPQARDKPREVAPATGLVRQHERLILIVEDDDKFASVLCDLTRDMSFDFAHATTAGAAVQMAQELRPDAILLDVRLPDYSGLTVLERLKRDPATRHIPVHMISIDDFRQVALELGAVGYTIKPAARDEIVGSIRKLEERLSRRVGKLLIVEDNAPLRESVTSMLGALGIEIVSVGTAAGALGALADSTFDCMVMDLNLPDASGFDMLEQMAASGIYSFPPVIVYTGRALSSEEEQNLRRYSKSIIIKGAKSPERLLDEVSLFLHRVEASLPQEHRQMLSLARQRDAIFEGRRILLAEDDIRNIYALTSVFEPLGATVEIARNGKEAVQRLASQKDIDLVLMDIMMPEMDGLAAMREIRKLPQCRNIPIVALTAKAMPDDRAECLEAGANDYIAKPIDVDQLVSLCRVWMPREALRA